MTPPMEEAEESAPAAKAGGSSPRRVIASKPREPPTESARVSLEDMVHYYVERILQTRSGRVEYYKSLAYFWGMHPARDMRFGYHYVRIRLAELMVEPFEGEQSRASADDSVLLTLPFANWTRERWYDYLEYVKETVKLALRQDATVELSRSDDEDLEDDTELPEPDWMDAVKPRVLDCISMNAALAPIRQELVELLEVAANDDRIELQDEASLQEFVHHVEKEVSDEYIQKLCRRLYVRSASNPQKHRLAGAGTIKNLFKYLNLQTLQEKIDEMVQRLNVEVFGTKEPELIRLRYRLPARSDVDAEGENRKPATSVRALRSNRQALNERVRDPLEQSRGASSPRRSGGDAAQASRRRERDRRGSKELTFEEESDTDPAPELSDLEPPRKKRSLFATHRLDKDNPPDAGLFDRNGHVTKRIPWTEEEKEAVKKGVESFGVGRWKDIKLRFGSLLRNRTSVQIKDCWRTMVLRGEVNPESAV